ncbi:U-box domain-containing protein [Trifolium repens]|jgi:vacuolar protein 8|nr:U-box domain-containing protein [Trifolium repens]
MDTPHSPSSCSSSSSTCSFEGHATDTIYLETEEPQTPLAVRRALQLLKSGVPELRIQAARDIRKLTKTSHRCRRQLSEAVGPLVSMLRVDSPESHEPALLALLNLAVKDEK